MTDARSMPNALPDGAVSAMHVTERTDGRTETLQDASRKLTFLNACDESAVKSK